MAERLISADALIKLIPPEESIARCIVANAPTVDAVPVVHGRWERLHMWTGFETLYCSECNYETTLASNYCPSCGADMRGEHDE